MEELQVFAVSNLETNMQGYAYILTHPGIPTVFYDHFYDCGDSMHDQIVKLVVYDYTHANCIIVSPVSYFYLSKLLTCVQIDIRKSQDIHSRSTIRILEAQPNLYAALIEEKLCMKIGDSSWCPSDGGWILATSGDNYAVWHK